MLKLAVLMREHILQRLASLPLLRSSMPAHDTESSPYSGYEQYSERRTRAIVLQILSKVSEEDWAEFHKHSGYARATLALQVRPD